tara:strand:+ start:2193 stop:2534 length:342 start_codon:yes stop_codon:yes gene_type:complete
MNQLTGSQLRQLEFSLIVILTPTSVPKLIHDHFEAIGEILKVEKIKKAQYTYPTLTVKVTSDDTLFYWANDMQVMLGVQGAKSLLQYILKLMLKMEAYLEIEYLQLHMIIARQ